MALVEARDLTFSYRIDGREIAVLDHLSFDVAPGELVAIQGPSGSGKSTLFHILGFLLKPTSGQVLLGGQDTSGLSADQLTLLRNQRIGFVFQQFYLLARASVLDNILLPARYPSELASVTAQELEKARHLAAKLGLENHLGHLPNQLSGGQQQRVAIARALMKDCDLILADEPTGNLDSHTASQTLELLRQLTVQGKTIILITHDSEVASRCERVLHLRDGRFIDPDGTEPGRQRAPHPIAEPARSPFQVPDLHTSFRAYRKIAFSVAPLVRENILRNKAKSLLTMLGVVIGVAAVLAMVTLGQYTKTKILETYETLGVNRLKIRAYRNWQMKASDQVSVSFQDFDWDRDLVPLRDIFPEVRYLSPMLLGWGVKATAGGIEVTEKVLLVGVSSEYLSITNRSVLRGRNITPYHVASKSPVCLIGFEIAQRLFEWDDPIGQVVVISDGQRLDFPCQVIGVLSAVTSNGGSTPPNLNVLVPYTYFQAVTDTWWSSRIHEATMQVDSTADVIAAGKKLKAYFTQRYGKSINFIVDADSTLVAQMKKFLNIFSVLLSAIAVLSLVVGGIGINNMMLVSVAERLKEFGIRKALGATHRSIRIQVLLESVTLCVLAGVIGAITGFAAYEFLIFCATQLVPNLKFEWIFDPVAATLSLVSIVAVGIASGLVPALRAERLQVIEALRSE